MADFLAKTAFDDIIASLETLKTDVETIYDNFDDRFLGAFASDPTTDNDGNALIDGALYWNTTSNSLKVYDLGNTTWVDFVALAEAAKTAAEAAQTAAETAETNAETSETNAATSETNAATSESNAATSEDNSETWAEGLDAAVSLLGGTHSSKGWAQISEAAATGSINLAQPLTGTAINVVSGETTDFQFAENPVDGFLVVNGAIQDENDYTISTDTITLDTAIPEDDGVFWFPTEETISTDTGVAITFTKNIVWNTVASPGTGNITDDLTNAKISRIQKIYHNDATEPTVPAGWVKLTGSQDYTTGSLNIIFAEWVSGTRVEYWIANEA